MKSAVLGARRVLAAADHGSLMIAAGVGQISNLRLADGHWTDTGRQMVSAAIHGPLASRPDSMHQ